MKGISEGEAKQKKDQQTHKAWSDGHLFYILLLATKMFSRMSYEIVLCKDDED